MRWGSVCLRCGNWRGCVAKSAAEPRLQTVHVNVNDRRGEKREHLTKDEAANDGDPQRAAKFGANSGAKSERHGAEKRSHGGH